jgi:hypothetical protein
MGWLVGLAIAVVVALLLVGLDRAVARGWFDRRRPRPERIASGSAAAGAFGSFLDAFQPGHEHLVQEQERQRLDIHYSGDNAPPLDLDSGVVRLDPPAAPAPGPGPAPTEAPGA